MSNRRRLLYIVFAIAVLAVAVQVASILITGKTTTVSHDSGAAHCSTEPTPLAIKCEVNAIRRQNGLGSLHTNLRLRAAAQRHADAMVKAHFFSHTGKNGSTPQARVAASGYLKSARSWVVGENIGYGAGNQGTPQAIVKAWMASPPHRAIILGTAWTDGGAGIARGTPKPSRLRGYTYVIDVAARSGGGS
jgi:uncharacterized protein YkwD